MRKGSKAKPEDSAFPAFRSYLSRLNPGPVDHELVRQYLCLKRPKDLAIIAASMAPRAEHFNPEQLMQNALALLTAADSLFLDQQKQLLQQMSAKTLLELGRVLNDDFDHDLTAYQNPDPLYDPKAAPLINHLRGIRENMPEEALRQEHERIAKILSPVGDTIPLPCSLEKALRYATGEKTIPLEALEQGFSDSLGLMLIDNTIGRESHTGLRISTIPHDSSQPPSEQKTQLDNMSAIHDPQILPTTANALSSREDRLTELRKRRAAFIPLWSAPDDVIDRAKKLLLELKKNKITDNSHLAEIVEGFRDFWGKYKAIYVGHFKEAKKHKSQVKKTKQKAGRAGTASREITKWRKVTETFCAYLQDESIYPESEDKLNLYFNSFKDSPQMPENASESNALKFLTHLWRAEDNPSKSSKILEELLSKDGFKTLQMEPARECVEMLAAQKSKNREFSG